MLTFGVYWWDPCYHIYIYSSTMDPMGYWIKPSFHDATICHQWQPGQNSSILKACLDMLRLSNLQAEVPFGLHNFDQSLCHHELTQITSSHPSKIGPYCSGIPNNELDPIADHMGFLKTIPKRGRYAHNPSKLGTFACLKIASPHKPRGSAHCSVGSTGCQAVHSNVADWEIQHKWRFQLGTSSINVCFYDSMCFHVFPCVPYVEELNITAW